MLKRLPDDFEDLMWVLTIICVPLLTGYALITQTTAKAAEGHAYTWETCAPLCVIDGRQYRPKMYTNDECWCDMQRVRMGVPNG